MIKVICEDLNKKVSSPDFVGEYLGIDDDIVLYFENFDNFIYLEVSRVDDESWDCLCNTTFKEEMECEELERLINLGYARLELKRRENEK